MPDIPDPALVAKLTDLHIEDPELVAGILGRQGLTVCPADPDCDEPVD